MAARDIIVIGASAGGVETLPRFFEGFAEELPAAFFVVMHLAPQSYSVMPKLIGRMTKLPAQHALDGEVIESGRFNQSFSANQFLEKARENAEHARLIREMLETL